MDYFKHYSTASEGNTLNHLEDKFGHMGYSSWFKLMELCCHNWDGKTKPEFTFFETVVRKKLRISSTKLRVFLKYCSSISELSFSFSEKNLNISVPMLAEIKETRGRISGNKLKKIDIYRIDKDLEEDIDKESNKDSKSSLDLSQAKAGFRLSNHFATFDETQLPDDRVGQIDYALKPRPPGIPEWPELKPDGLIQMFNEKLALKAGKIQHCRGLSADQIKSFITTSSYKEFSTAKVWEEIFEKVSRSPFLNGSQKGSNWVATLDWLVIHGNALKVINGKYQEASGDESKADSNQNFINSVELK